MMPRYWDAHSDRDFEDPFGDARDDFEDDGPDPSEECGRWRNGKLAPESECLSAGTEFCLMECPMHSVSLGAERGRR